MLSKKYYKRIAEIVRRNPYNEKAFLFELCIFFKQDNVLFDKEKFLLACGYG